MAITVNKGDTPNQFRVKVNTNFTTLEASDNLKLNIDGSNAMLAPLPMGGNRVINMGSGVLANDAASLGQVQNMANRLVQARCAYVINGFGSTETIYVDGTTTYALKVGTLNDAFTGITDSSAGNEWTVIIGPGSYSDTAMQSIPNYVNLHGVGNVEITTNLDDPGVDPNDTTITSNGKWDNIKIKSPATGNFVIQGNTKITNTTLYAPSAFLVLGGVKAEYSKLIGKSGSKIQLDSTSSNYVNFCTLSEDFYGIGSYDTNTSNVINTNLETYFNF